MTGMRRKMSPRRKMSSRRKMSVESMEQSANDHACMLGGAKKK